MASTPTKFSVAIIGGGIGGLSLAIGLLECKNIDVQIYESAPKFSEVGLGVNMAPNAQRALAMISPKTEKAFLDEATSNGWESHKKNYTTVVVGAKGPDENKIITTPVNSIGLRSVHRARFLENLVKNIPGERAHFNKRLIGVDPYDWGEKIRMHFRDGTTAEADCVVGADGIHSMCRKIIIGEDQPMTEPKYTGTACFRSIVPMERAIEKLGGEYAENCHLLCGPGAAIFSYPVEHGKLFNIIMMQFDHSKWESAEWVVPTTREELVDIFKGWGKTAENMMDLMDKTNLTAWAMHDHPIAPCYNKTRVCIMGDAAHATTPFQGQGAGQAIEDALVLKTLLAETENIHQIRHAFHAFDLTRRARTEKVIATSRHSGHVYGFLAENIGSDIKKIKEEMDTSQRWMWNRDLEGQNREALTLYREAISSN